jgi:hypothetical protein
VRRLALAAAALVLLTGCNLSLAVNVDAHADGSGTVTAQVTLDKEAAERLAHAGGRLEADDLRKAGWKITGPTDRKDGGAVLTATKGFNTPDELTAVIDEVAGPRHPLRDFKLRRERSFARTRTAFSGVVDLTGGVGAFGDDRLREQTGADAGVDTAELERQAGVAINKFFTIHVAVRLPGAASSNAPSRAGNGAVWRPKLGERAVLTAAGSAVDTTRVALLGMSGAAVLALGIVLGGRALRRRQAATG